MFCRTPKRVPIFVFFGGFFLLCLPVNNLSNKLERYNTPSARITNVKTFMNSSLSQECWGESKKPTTTTPGHRSVVPVCHPVRSGPELRWCCTGSGWSSGSCHLRYSRSRQPGRRGPLWQPYRLYKERKKVRTTTNWGEGWLKQVEVYIFSLRLPKRKFTFSVFVFDKDEQIKDGG